MKEMYIHFKLEVWFILICVSSFYTPSYIITLHHAQACSGECWVMCRLKRSNIRSADNHVTRRPDMGWSLPIWSQRWSTPRNKWNKCPDFKRDCEKRKRSERVKSRPVASSSVSPWSCRCWSCVVLVFCPLRLFVSPPSDCCCCTEWLTGGLIVLAELSFASSVGTVQN